MLGWLFANASPFWLVIVNPLKASKGDDLHLTTPLAFSLMFQSTQLPANSNRFFLATNTTEILHKYRKFGWPYLQQRNIAQIILQEIWAVGPFATLFRAHQFPRKPFLWSKLLLYLYFTHACIMQQNFSSSTTVDYFATFLSMKKHKTCREDLSRRLVVKTCREDLSRRLVAKTCHEDLSWKLVAKTCHEDLSRRLVE